MASENINPVIEDTEEFRDHIATVDNQGKRIWIFPKKPSGRYYNARTWVSLLFLIIFFGMPFIKVDGEQFLLFNVFERKFVLFGLLFTPQDFHLFALAMLTFFVFIVLFTVVYGRLFCGWVCPQTVFMELIFRKIEYWIDGDFNEQRKLSKAPWNGEKIRKRALKHFIFFTFSFIVGNFFLAYIISIDQVIKLVTDPVNQHWSGLAGMLIFAGLFYMTYARLREQVCTTICPYGRLQGVLLVKDSIVVAYDHKRGEPRGKMKKTAAAADSPVQNIRNLVATDTASAVQNGYKKRDDGFGECIDCKLCIAVCPTGIDIRNGTQLECTNCTACMDACDQVMDKVGFPRNLIRYDSMTGIESGKRKIFTPRVWAYTAVLVALVALDVLLIAKRGVVETIILRSPGQMYQEKGNNHYTNLYTYVVINKSTGELPVTIKTPTEGAVLQLVGQPPAPIEKGKKAEGAFFIEMPGDKLTGRKTEIKIEVYSGDKKIDEVKTNFLGPGSISGH